jgi:phosphoribosylformylglycinamidine cyclo-ligase
VPELEQTVGQTLLTPTHVYARAVRAVLKHYKVKSVVHGIAHITGGGLLENIERIVPPYAQVRIRPDSWEVPPVFGWLQRLGSIDNDEMNRVFNMGIGMVLIVSSFFADSVRRMLGDQSLESWRIGTVVEGPRSVTWDRP